MAANTSICAGSLLRRPLQPPYDQTFTISDEQNFQMTPTLVPDFAEVTLSTAEGAEILVNGEYKGTRKWSGKLSNGSYIFETRMQGQATVLENTR